MDHKSDGLFAVFGGANLDAVDECPNLGDQPIGLLAGLEIAEVDVQLVDDLAVGREGGRMQFDDFGRGGRDLLFERGLLGFHFLELGHQRRRRLASNKQVDGALDGGGQLVDAMALGRIGRAPRLGSILHRLAIGPHVLGHHIAGRELRLQHGNDALLDVREGDGSVVAAIAALAEAGAAAAALAERGVARAAMGADQQAREQVPGPALVRLVALGEGRAPPLHGLEYLRRDDRQLGNLLAQPGRFGIGARHTLAGRGVLDEALAVPDALAGVEGVLQDAVLAGAASVDGRGVPAVAVRTFDAFAVERRRDRPRIVAGEIVAQNAPHHGGFGLVDHKAALAGGVRPIAIGPTACRRACAHPSAEASPRSLREVGEEHFAHHAAQADLHGADLAIGEGHDRDAEEVEVAPDAGDVRKVAAQPVGVLADDHVEALVACGAQHALQLEAVDHRGA